MTQKITLYRFDQMPTSGRSFFGAGIHMAAKWFVLCVACLSISASTFVPQREVKRMVPGALPAELSAVDHLSPERVALLLDVLRSPEKLSVYDEQRMNTALGMPKLVRQQQQTRVWQFGQNDCVLDVYYTATHKKPAHITLRTTLTPRSCLLQLALKA